MKKIFKKLKPEFDTNFIFNIKLKAEEESL